MREEVTESKHAIEIFRKKKRFSHVLEKEKKNNATRYMGRRHWQHFTIRPSPWWPFTPSVQPAPTPDRQFVYLLHIQQQPAPAHRRSCEFPFPNLQSLVLCFSSFQCPVFLSIFIWSPQCFLFLAANTCMAASSSTSAARASTDGSAIVDRWGRRSLK